MNIFLSSDDNYVPYLGATISSILCNAKTNETFSFYILDSGISEANRKKITKLQGIKKNSLEFTKLNLKELENYPKHSYPLSAYSRLKIPSLFPHLKKILYLDCDIIVRNSLTPLWNTNINNHLFGAAKDLFSSSNKGFSHKAQLGMPRSATYFNSGVLLMNLEKLRNESFERQCENWIKKK